MTTYANIYNPAVQDIMGDREKFFRDLQSYPKQTPSSFPQPLGGMPFGGQGISPMLSGIKMFLQQKPNENLDQFMSELEGMINNYGSNQTTTAGSTTTASPVETYPVDENLDNAMNSGIYGLNGV